MENKRSEVRELPKFTSNCEVEEYIIDQTSNEISTTNNSEGSLSIAPETMDSTKSEETDLYSSGFDEDLEHL